MTDTPNVRIIPLADIQADPANYRKTFDAAELAELTASVKEHGVLVDISVRPTPPFPDKYVVTDGERRYRAARAAGLTAIQCKVEALSDTAARRRSVVLNEQRADVPLLEKVDGYQALLDDGTTLDELGVILSRSPTTLRALLKLRLLPAAARAALAAGRISPSVAALIAARPTAAMRERAADYALAPVNQWGEPAAQGDALPTARQVKDWIGRILMVPLSQAPFDRKDGSLCPPAGSCQDCPKRAGNAGPEFADARPDTCTDPECYADKVEAWQCREITRAEGKGATLIAPAEIKRLWPYGLNTWAVEKAGFYEAKAKCPFDAGGRTYKKLLEGKVPGDAWQLVAPDDGTVWVLIARKTADPVLEKEYKIKRAGANGHAPAAGAGVGPAEKKRREQEANRRADDRRRLLEVLQEVGLRIGKSEVAPDLAEPLRRAARWAHKELWSQYRDEIYRQQNIAGKTAADKFRAQDEALAGMAPAALLGFVLRCALTCDAMAGAAEAVFALIAAPKPAAPDKRKPGRPKKAVKP